MAEKKASAEPVDKAAPAAVTVENAPVTPASKAEKAPAKPPITEEVKKGVHEVNGLKVEYK